MKMRPIVLCIVFILGVIYSAVAGYDIRGKVNLSPQWQRQIFLATINKIDDYYKADPEAIIQVGTIKEDGSFYLNGDNLLPEKRFYRLYVIKESNTEFDACIYVDGDDHNFVHLILDNNTQIEILPEHDQAAPFGRYSVISNKENVLMNELSRIVTPSFYFNQIKFPSELQFSQMKLNRDLMQFADSCSIPLVSLAAIMSTDMDQNFDQYNDQYKTIAERLAIHLPNHTYTDNYFRKLKYYNGHTGKGEQIPPWIMIAIAILVGALMVAFIKIKSLQNRLHNYETQKDGVTDHPKPMLTSQEEKILKLIIEGNSNKEIANTLHIELSTVKTHINKLYAKIKAKNRNEAKEIGKNLISTGV